MTGEYGVNVTDRGTLIQLGPAGIVALIHAWERTVQDISEGRKLSDKDYLYNLDLRSAIETFVMAHPLGVSDALNRLSHADEKFLALTRPSDLCAWGAAKEMEFGYERQSHWWLYRTRKILTDDPRD